MEFAELLREVVGMDGRRALAKAFDDWYSSSGLNQGQVAAAGGPSTTTQGTGRENPVAT